MRSKSSKISGIKKLGSSEVLGEERYFDDFEVEPGALLDYTEGRMVRGYNQREIENARRMGVFGRPPNRPDLYDKCPGCGVRAGAGYEMMHGVGCSLAYNT